MKYDSAVAEAADLIANNGFALYEEGSVDEPAGMRYCLFCSEPVKREHAFDPWFHETSGQERCDGHDEFAVPSVGIPTVGGWNALVAVTSTSLLNLGADEDLRERLINEHPEARDGEVLTWIRTNGDGFVATVQAGDSEVEQAWHVVFPD